MNARARTLLTVSIFVGCAPLAAQCGNPWIAGTAPFDDEVHATTMWDPDGSGPLPARVVAGGSFGQLGGGVPSRIASYDPVAQAWVPVGTGLGYVPYVGQNVLALSTLANGDLVAGGDFYGAFGVPALFVARFDGTSWSALGSGAPNRVSALATLPNGNLVASCYHDVAVWDGTSWSILGTTNGNPGPLLAMPNGDLIVGGSFTSIGGVAANNIARWDGTAWSPLGAGTSYPSYGSQVNALLRHSSGDVIAGGFFAYAGANIAFHVARWNGTSWSPLGVGFPAGFPAGTVSVSALAELPDGDIVAAGTIPSLGHVARFSGSAWSAFGAGVGVGGFPYNWTTTLTMEPEGRLAVGGRFLTVGGVSSPYIAWVGTTCSATASASGLGCASSGGTNTLTATTLPWVDATFRATGTGLPVTALVLTLTSVTPVPQGIGPLTLFFSQAGVGCDVLVAPDILGLLVTTTGTATSDLFLPNVPPLVGVTFYHQMVPIELGAGGAWTAVTATNALQLVAGMF